MPDLQPVNSRINEGVLEEFLYDTIQALLPSLQAVNDCDIELQ